MTVDKNLFLYDLAVVAIMKNEGPYIKEWLDYYLLAGVDHFFIYDNDSPDNQKAVLQPYIDAGIVTYIFYPGVARQMDAYNDAINNFKYFCRYMAFIDGDEFILPKSKPTIPEVVDEILLPDPRAVALGVNWVMYGSNHHDNADYNHGVLERFLAHEKGVNVQVKTIVNPRKVNYFSNPHYAVYFAGECAVNEAGEFFVGPFNDPGTVDKIQINHYHTKSREEWEKKVQRGRATLADKRDVKIFSHDKDNEVFDDEILRYREERRKPLAKLGGVDELSFFAERNQLDFDKLLKALSSNLLYGFEDGTQKFFDNPTNRFNYFSTLSNFLETAPPGFFEDKLETFLTCLALSTYLKETVLDDELGRLFEEFSLYALDLLCKYPSNLTATDVQMLLRYMPNILEMPYPVVDKVRIGAIEAINYLRNIVHDIIPHTHDLLLWQSICELDNHLKMLAVFDNYTHK